jgi:hypothetical protein
MCIICIEYQQGKLTPLEGMRNLQEMKDIIDDEHYYEVFTTLYDDYLDEENKKDLDNKKGGSKCGTKS